MKEGQTNITAFTDMSTILSTVSLKRLMILITKPDCWLMVCPRYGLPCKTHGSPLLSHLLGNSKLYDVCFSSDLKFNLKIPF